MPADVSTSSLLVCSSGNVAAGWIQLQPLQRYHIFVLIELLQFFDRQFGSIVRFMHDGGFDESQRFGVIRMILPLRYPGIFAIILARMWRDSDSAAENRLVGSRWSVAVGHVVAGLSVCPGISTL